MTEQVIDLIARLEKATGPDRELDAAIKLAHAAFLISAGGTKAEMVAALGGYLNDQPRRYTESLDAALTLVPEGCRWTVFHPAYDQGIYQDGKAGADIHSSWSSGGGPRWKGFSATPALALCVASLRARMK